jgi:hypothetical protein
MGTRGWGSVATTFAALVALGTWGVPGATAKALPDLTIGKASVGRAAAPPGGRFPATLTVVNRGGGAARRSTVRFYLAKKARRGRGDRALSGPAKVTALRARKQAQIRATLRLPKRVKAGRYRVLACADGAAKVRERNERNNCRAAKGSVRVLRASRKDVPPFRPKPLTVNPTLDGGRAVTQTVTPEGGRLTATGADGTTYTLTLPKGAVINPVAITMTPLAAVAGMPFGGGLGGGVQLGPDGLVLLAPAKLEIRPPAPVPLARRAAFAYAGEGRDFHLHPSSHDAKAIEFELLHFSAYGWGKATAADRAATVKRVPSTREAWAEQNIARAAQEAKLGGEDARGRWIDAMLYGFYVWGEDGVRPALTKALSDDAVAESAVREYVSWERVNQLLGGTEDLEAMSAEFNDLFHRVFDFAIARASERCVQNKDPYQALRMLSLERESQLIGRAADPTVWERIAKCLRFELQIDFRLVFDFLEHPLRQGVDEGHIVFALNMEPGEFGMRPVSATPQLTAATLGPPTAEFRWAWAGTTEVLEPAVVQRFLVDFSGPATGGEPPEPKIEVDLQWARLREPGTLTGCSEGGRCQSVSQPSSTHTVVMWALGGYETEIRDWTIETGAGNEVFATKDRERSGTNEGGTGHETLHLRLLHKPVA